ncbi:cyclic nucleotide-binding domain-containing protein [Entomospira nematocerorum]|uniref:Cyclic nucleotide-binding domain-containing protein n=1 Tax=Entomospira nematocerorum TaxID=2719987 RepID=A0A968GCL6_9SPIO|nr:cyclic nucleotide-binding domain-containing protein [Entomospira nematocera]NIZ47375.1 cyclic nucleotide-binding domain-containing protein [Entomospira nematocera]WDI34085.1 cyclic nucleotide-binding domain-containing protein [Entomospira nematocera]
MRKFQITNGVYFLDCHEVGLRILCGCPMDSVKLLMRAGFIQRIEDENWLWETGANAILLSDISVQNGAFANLTEFPLMHMLYNQGLGVSNHPGYTGKKPMILGIPEQLEGQIEYLDRGVNGLTPEELDNIDDIDNDVKREIQVFKKRFKYGKPQSSRDLVDFFEVKANEEPYEIAPELYLVRLGLNVYLFQYQDQEEIIDLTLTEMQQYGIPYNLDFHPMHKRDFAILHSGEGNGWDKDRPCMSSVICAEGRYYLIDAGPNVLEALEKFGISLSEVEGVFMTHAHDDHFNGLTGLMRSQKRMKLFTSKVVRVSIMRKLMALLNFEEATFSKFFDIHDLSLDSWTHIGQLQVMPVLSPHPVETNIFYFKMVDDAGTVRSYGHLADVISQRVHQNFLRIQDEDQAFLLSRYERVWRNYLRAVNVKKIDANGGLIHGEIDDFKDDHSAKVIVSHTTERPTLGQRLVASSVNFGVEELLIPSTRDYFNIGAQIYLDEIFPEAPFMAKAELIDNRRLLINPGLVLIKRGELHDYVYLLVSGIFEYITPRDSKRYEAGMILGEESIILNQPSDGTYRSLSYAKVIRIEAQAYLNFIEKYLNLDEYIEEHTKRKKLQDSDLFKSLTSRNLLDSIYSKISVVNYIEGNLLREGYSDSIGIIIEGMAGIFHKENLVETLTEDYFYGQEVVFSRSRHLVPNVVALSEVKVMQIPLEVLSSVPILLWNLLESGDKISKLVAQADRLISYMNELANDLVMNQVESEGASYDEDD